MSVARETTKNLLAEKLDVECTIMVHSTSNFSASRFFVVTFCKIYTEIDMGTSQFPYKFPIGFCAGRLKDDDNQLEIL